MVKRILLIAFLAFGIAALASAQHWGWSGNGWGHFPGVQAPVVEQVTVSGALTIVQGSLAVKSGDSTYLVPGLLRYAGFIDSLKDGAQVILEGSATTSAYDAKTKMLWVSKLNIGGKDYDLTRPRQAMPASGWPRTFDYNSPMMPQMHHNRRY